MEMSAGHGPADGAGGTGGAGGAGGGYEEQLLCGRTLDEVWEAWDTDRATSDPHYAACPHCTSALDGLRALDDFVATARTEDAAERAETAQDGSADRTADAVTAKVMEIVRMELRPGRRLPLGERRDDVWIVEAAAAKTLRAAAETLPGVRAGSCLIDPLGGPDAPGDSAGAVRVRLEVAADLSRSVPELAESVRARVAAAAREAVGLEVAAVDVAVVDLLAEPDEAEASDPW